MVAGRNYSDPLGSSEEISPLMLANYKTSDGVSYEDLLDFALDRYGIFYMSLPVYYIHLNSSPYMFCIRIYLCHRSYNMEACLVCIQCLKGKEHLYSKSAQSHLSCGDHCTGNFC